MRHSTSSEGALDQTLGFWNYDQSGFLKRLLGLPATRSATFYTRLIDEQIDQLVDKAKDLDAVALALGAYFWMIRQRRPVASGPWQSREMTGWHMAAGGDGLSPIPILHLETAGASAEIRFAPLKADGSMRIVGINDEKLPVKLISLKDDTSQRLSACGGEGGAHLSGKSNRLVHDRRGVHR